MGRRHGPGLHRSGLHRPGLHRQLPGRFNRRCFDVLHGPVGHLPRTHGPARGCRVARRVLLVGPGRLGVLHTHGPQPVGHRPDTVLHLGRPHRLNLGRVDRLDDEDDEIGVVLVVLRFLLGPTGRPRLGLPTLLLPLPRPS